MPDSDLDRPTETWSIDSKGNFWRASASWVGPAHEEAEHEELIEPDELLRLLREDLPRRRT